MKYAVQAALLALTVAGASVYSSPAAAMQNAAACNNALNVLSSAPEWSPQYWLAAVYYYYGC